MTGVLKAIKLNDLIVLGLYRAFEKEPYDGIPNVTLWLVLLKVLDDG
jgi:hypothetical protein